MALICRKWLDLEQSSLTSLTLRASSAVNALSKNSEPREFIQDLIQRLFYFSKGNIKKYQLLLGECRSGMCENLNSSKGLFLY